MRKVERRLDAIYAEIPTIDCKGLCAESCGPISVSPDEWRRMKETGGKEPGVNPKTFVCNMLKDGRCSIYQARPAICRLFGVVEDLRCPHGCVPTRLLRREEAFRFFRRVNKATGGKPMVATGRVP